MNPDLPDKSSVINDPALIKLNWSARVAQVVSALDEIGWKRKSERAYTDWFDAAHKVKRYPTIKNVLAAEEKIRRRRTRYEKLTF
jgi:hypothetical protein